MDQIDSLRKNLSALLRGGDAFETFDQIVTSFEPDMRGVIPASAGHSPWQILEHMRICLRDILDYSQNEEGRYKELDWPSAYWPSETDGDWAETIHMFKHDMAELERLVSSRDLFAPFPWAPEHPLLREVLVVAEHNAHHLGQLVMLRRWF